MDERLQKAFDAANDVTKQLLTLATAIIAGFVTFAKPSNANTLDFKSWGVSVTIAMLCMAISVVAGLLTLMNLTGELGNIAEIPAPSPYKARIRGCAAVQVIAFAIGAVVLALFVPIWQWPWSK